MSFSGRIAGPLGPPEGDRDNIQGLRLVSVRDEQSGLAKALKWLSPYLESVSLVFLIAGLQNSLGSLLEDEARFTVLHIATCYAVWRGGILTGLVALLSSCIVGDYFFKAPRFSLLVHSRGDVVSLVLYLVLGVAIILFGEAHRAQRRKVLEREKELKLVNEQLVETNKQLDELLERRTADLQEIRRWAADELCA